MSSMLTTLKEWVNPGWGRHRIVPPMEAGLRPNLRIDQGEELLTSGQFEPDDVVIREDGTVVFSAGSSIHELRDGRVSRQVVCFDGPVTALAVASGALVAAVDGTGLVTVDEAGRVAALCDDPSVASCVTDLAVLPDGAIVAAIGSAARGIDDWARGLVEGDRSGSLVRVDGRAATVLATGLAWPAGVCADGDEVLISLSHDHRVERRVLMAPARPGRPLAVNLPVYPGRIRRGVDGVWVAAPYIRNRVTEMLLDEHQLLDEMVRTIRPDEWFVPRLRAGNPFTDTMQMGQLRVLGVVKSWAPARSCGVVFRIDASGRIAESAHARVDSPRHGITGLAVRQGELVVAARGHGNLIRLEAT